MRQLALALFLFASTSVFAGPIPVEDILRQTERPNMSAIEPWLEKIKFPAGIPVDSAWAQANNYDTRIAIREWTDIIIKYAPKLIATVEKAYPGATWVFIGRDGAAFADVFEAFYAELGQKERVIRLNVSKASFDNITVDHIKSALAQGGYKVDYWKSSNPLLIIDPVSKGNGRQGRLLLAHLYNYLIQTQNAKLLEIYKKLNMLGLVVSTHPGNYIRIEDPSSYERAFTANAGQLTSTSVDALFNSHTFMSVGQAASYANEAGYTHYIGAWTDSFGEFQWTTDRRAATRTGAAFPREMRLSILWTQKKIWKAVKNPDFLARVKTEALAMGYKFPFDCERALKAAGG